MPKKPLISIGYGYSLGKRATGFESIRKARKKYECGACLIDSDAVSPETEISPGTGGVVFEGCADTCSKNIEIGDLYVALNFIGEDAQDLGGTYRYTHRTCLACAQHFETVVLTSEV